MNNLSVCLGVLILILLYMFHTSHFANSPYTVPYMMDVISPYATYECINHPTAYTVNGTWALT